MRTPITVLAILLAASTARADDAGVIVTGEATLQPQLAAELEGWLRQHGRTLVASPLEPDAINTLIDCFVIEDQACARNLVEKRAKSQAIVFARVDVTPNQKDGTRDVAIVAYWFQRGHDPFSEKRSCQRCTEPALRAAADDLMQALAYHATVTQDQLPAATPVQPAPAPVAPDPPVEEGGPSRLVPMTLVGVGAAALLTGVVLLAIDEDPTPTGVQQATYRDTDTSGVVFGLAGAAAVGVGVYLWLHPSAGSAPVASVGRDGGTIGWAGRF